MSEHDASYYERQFNDRQEPSSRREGFPCRDPFHDDLCWGTPHRLRPAAEVWCAECIEEATACIRVSPSVLISYCTLHALVAAQVYAHAAGLPKPPVGGIEQYQAEDR